MFNTIVVGTDGSPSATDALREAVRLAATFGSALHVVCAARSALSTAALAASAGIDPGFAEIEQHAREHATSVLEEAKALASTAGVTVTGHAETGNAAEAILSVADGQGADLIVVGNLGMKGARRLLGSVPSNIAHHARCSVLIVQTS